MTNERQDLILVIVLLGAGFLMMFAMIFVLMFAFMGIEADFSDSFGSKKEGIGVIEIVGVIEDSTPILEDLAKFAEQEHVKGIIIRVDSGGGGVAPSQEIYNEIKRLKEKKTIVASFGNIAASGGYYVACPAERVFSNPGTITGSIGVIIHTTYMKELFDFIKIEPIIFKSGEHKDILSPMRKPTEAEKDLLKTMLMDVYNQFLTAVSEARGIDIETLKPIADGRIMTGRQAFEHGLVDELGGLPDAIRYIAEKEGLGERPNLIYPEEEPLNYLEKLLKTSVQSFANALDEQSRTKIEFRSTP